jgi:hypothetical protein
MRLSTGEMRKRALRRMGKTRMREYGRLEGHGHELTELLLGRGAVVDGPQGPGGSLFISFVFILFQAVKSCCGQKFHPASDPKLILDSKNKPEPTGCTGLIGYFSDGLRRIRRIKRP